MGKWGIKLSAAINITGIKYGKLTPIENIGSKNKLRIWNCRCDCGNSTVVTAKDLRSGNTKSCGCFHKESIKSIHSVNRVTKHCVVCTKSISIKKSHSLTEGTYCSKQCMKTGYKEKNKGSGNPNYKDGLSKDKDYINKRAILYFKNNPERRREYNRNCRAKRRLSLGKHTKDDVRWKLLIQKNKCYWCLETIGDKYHVDHVIPISKGGSNNPHNIVVACIPCNLQKRAFLPKEWFLRPSCRAKRFDYESRTVCESV